MPSKNSTTVVLTKKSQTIKDELAPVFGLKRILSAGLILFDKLSPADKMKVIAEAYGVEYPESSQKKDKKT